MEEFNWNEVQVRELPTGKRRKHGFLHVDSLDWVQRAFTATRSKQQFAFALLLHRHCRMHKSGGTITKVRAVAAQWEISHDVAARTIKRLTAAGLIEADRVPGSPYRVRVRSAA